MQNKQERILHTNKVIVEHFKNFSYPTLENKIYAAEYPISIILKEDLQETQSFGDIEDIVRSIECLKDYPDNLIETLVNMLAFYIIKHPK